MKPKFKKGDKVQIIPSVTHEAYVIGFYYQTHEVENIVQVDYNEYVYKIKGIPNYAQEDDLELLTK